MQTASRFITLVLAISLALCGSLSAWADPTPTPPAALTPSPLKKASRTRRAPLPNDEYDQPLMFDVIGDGVEFLPLRLDWDLSSGRELLLSGQSFSDRSFMIGIYKQGQLERHVRDLLDGKAREDWVMIARWPRELMSAAGVMEALNRSGHVIWHQNVSASDLTSWQSQLGQWKAAILRQKRATPEELDRATLFKTNVGLLHFKQSYQPFWSLQEPVKMCFTSDAGQGLLSRMCTRFVEAKSDGRGGIMLLPVSRTEETARVIVMNEAADLQGGRDVEVDKPVQFYAELSSGSTYEFIAKPQHMNVVEMIDLENGQAKVTAWGAQPIGRVHQIEQEHLSVLEHLFGSWWYETIGDTKVFWEANFDIQKPEFFMPGEGGGLFRQELKITKLPKEKIRPYLRHHSLHVTYIDDAKFLGRAAAGTKASSAMNSADASHDGSGDFKWYFGAKEKGEDNRSYLLVNDGENSFRAYRDVYRGYAGEVSARLTGIYGSGGNLVLMGELATTYWFESILGWSQYYLSRDRWGVSAKYFQSFNQITLGSFADTLTDTDVDIKYRFDPGLWSRDETWGVELAYSQISYSQFQYALLGGGVFWARSMPKLIDDIFNWLPIMRYPKWVDMEFKYYPSSLNSSIVPQNFGAGLGNWQLNFHGKVMWTKQFFGEAGFGIKQIDVDKTYSYYGFPASYELQLTSFYGTVGLGYSF